LSTQPKNFEFLNKFMTCGFISHPSTTLLFPIISRYPDSF
jgi:hypothetical protein